MTSRELSVRRPAGWTTNNFDLLRLAAASQVVWYHSVLLLRITTPGIRGATRFTDMFPGVPVFFVISGFLVSASYERSESLGDYLSKRATRIYPGLWLCFVFTLVVLGAYGFLTRELLVSGRFPAWVLAQLTVAITTPSALRGFGVGVPNGSLWTISIEVGFYVALPLLYVAIKRLRQRYELVGFATVGAASLALWFLVVAGAPDPSHSHLTIRFLVAISPLPYLWLFLVGILCSRHLPRLLGIVAGRGVWFLAGYIVLGYTVFSRAYAGHASGLDSAARAIALCCLGVTVLALAYTAPGAARRLLRGNDFSYGVYLYHFVVVNIVVMSLHPPYRLRHVVFVAAATAVCAVVSWFAVERPAKKAAPTVRRWLAFRA